MQMLLFAKRRLPTVDTNRTEAAPGGLLGRQCRHSWQARAGWLAGKTNSQLAPESGWPAVGRNQPAGSRRGCGTESSEIVGATKKWLASKPGGVIAPTGTLACHWLASQSVSPSPASESAGSPLVLVLLLSNQIHGMRIFATSTPGASRKLAGLFARPALQHEPGETHGLASRPDWKPPSGAGGIHLLPAGRPSRRQGTSCAG